MTDYEMFKTKMTLKKKNSFTSNKLYPWVLILLCASLLFYKYILNVSPSIMSHELMKQFQVSGAELGSLSATFFYSYTVMQVFSGVLIDKFGTRYLTGLTVLVGALGAYVFAHSDTLNTATLARGMMGFGISFATVAYLKITAVWFHQRQKAFVSGLLATAVMLGAVFGEAPLATLLEKTSWRFVLEFCAYLGIFLSLLFMIFVREHKDKNAPDKELSNEKTPWQEYKKVIQKKQNWLLTAYSGLAFAPLSVLGGLWGPPFLQESYGLSRTESSGLISLTFIGLGIGSPLWGLLSDRLNNRLGVMKVALILSLVSLTFVFYSPHLPVWCLGTLLFLFGFGVGAFMLGFTLATQTNNLALAATVVSLINTGDSILESFTEPFLGKLLDFGWSGQMKDGARYFSVHDYHTAFLPLPAYLILAYFLLCFIREGDGKQAES